MSDDDNAYQKLLKEAQEAVSPYEKIERERMERELALEAAEIRVLLHKIINLDDADFAARKELDRRRVQVEKQREKAIQQRLVAKRLVTQHTYFGDAARKSGYQQDVYKYNKEIAQLDKKLEMFADIEKYIQKNLRKKQEPEKQKNIFTNQKNVDDRVSENPNRPMDKVEDRAKLAESAQSAELNADPSDYSKYLDHNNEVHSQAENVIEQKLENPGLEEHKENKPGARSTANSAQWIKNVIQKQVQANANKQSPEIDDLNNELQDEVADQAELQQTTVSDKDQENSVEAEKPQVKQEAPDLQPGRSDSERAVSQADAEQQAVEQKSIDVDHQKEMSFLREKQVSASESRPHDLKSEQQKEVIDQSEAPQAVSSDKDQETTVEAEKPKMEQEAPDLQPGKSKSEEPVSQSDLQQQKTAEQSNDLEKNALNSQQSGAESSADVADQLIKADEQDHDHQKSKVTLADLEKTRDRILQNDGRDSASAEALKNKQILIEKQLEKKINEYKSSGDEHSAKQHMSEIKGLRSDLHKTRLSKLMVTGDEMKAYKEELKAINKQIKEFKEAESRQAKPDSEKTQQRPNNAQSESQNQKDMSYLRQKQTSANESRQKEDAQSKLSDEQLKKMDSMIKQIDEREEKNQSMSPEERLEAEQRKRQEEEERNKSAGMKR